MRSAHLGFTLGLALVAGCASSTRPVTREVDPDAQFDAAIGETVHVSAADVAVTVVSVAESRCPADVTCIQAGDVVVALQVVADGSSRTDTLRLRAEPNAVSGPGYRIELVDVRPYPRSKDRDRVSTAVLRIARVP